MSTSEKESTAVAKRPESPGTAVVPSELEALFQEQRGVGMEDMTQADKVTPFLGLVQGLSPQIDRSKPGYLEDAAIGSIFNTVTGEVYDGAKGVRVIPVLFQKVWNTWIPRDLGGGFLGSYADPDLRTPIFVPPSTSEHDGPVQISETANHFVLAESADGTWGPAILSMTSTKLKASRKWNTLTTIATNKYKAPVFARIYLITSVSEQNEKGTFANYKIEDAGFVTPELFEMAKALRIMIQAGIVRADMTKSTDAQEQEVTVETNPDGTSKY